MNAYDELRVLLSRSHAHGEEAGGSSHPTAGHVLGSGSCSPAVGPVKLCLWASLPAPVVGTFRVYPHKVLRTGSGTG